MMTCSSNIQHHTRMLNNQWMLHVHDHQLMIQDIEQTNIGTKTIVKIHVACIQEVTMVPALTKRSMANRFRPRPRRIYAECARDSDCV